MHFSDCNHNCILECLDNALRQLGSSFREVRFLFSLQNSKTKKKMKRLSILSVVFVVFLAIALGCCFPMFAKVAAVILAMIVFMTVAGFVLMYCCKEEDE